MKYRWRNQGLGNVKAQNVGETIHTIIEENAGAVIPSTIVRAARPKKSPIHNCFEWDDKQAANKFRETQAQYLLRQIVIVQEISEDSEPIQIRAFVSVGNEDGHYYTTIQRAVKDPELYEGVIEQAYDDYTALRNKYKNLKEFQSVNNEIDKVKI